MECKLHLCDTRTLLFLLLDYVFKTRELTNCAPLLTILSFWFHNLLSASCFLLPNPFQTQSLHVVTTTTRHGSRKNDCYDLTRILQEGQKSLTIKKTFKRLLHGWRQRKSSNPRKSNRRWYRRSKGRNSRWIWPCNSLSRWLKVFLPTWWQAESFVSFCAPFCWQDVGPAAFLESIVLLLESIQAQWILVKHALPVDPALQNCLIPNMAEGSVLLKYCYFRSGKKE